MFDLHVKLLEKIENQWQSPGNIRLKWILNRGDDRQLGPYGATAVTLAQHLRLHETTVRKRLKELVARRRVIKFTMEGHPDRYWPVGGKDKLKDKLNSAT